MKPILFSINSWIFGNASIEDIARRARQIGVSGLDISGEPDQVDLAEVQQALTKYGLVPVCINGNFLDETRTFCHSDPRCRSTAVDYGKKCVDMAVALGAQKVLIVPSQVFRTTYFDSAEQDWQNAVQSLREVADYAWHQGNITIMLECVNKYEVTLVRTLRDGIRMATDVGRENVKLVADTFHMQLEEEMGIHNALRRAGKHWLAHLHVGDNTREVPGRGCINWKEIFVALSDINYEEAISFEPLPHRMTPEEIFGGKLDPDELDQELAFSLNYLTSIMQSVQ